jgi:hypothetical protein
MVVAVALLSFGVSCYVGYVYTRRVCRRIGPSLKEWTGPTGLNTHSGKVGGSFITLACAVGFEGFGAPAAVRAALLGMVFVEGMRRNLRESKEDGPRASTRTDAGPPL